MDNITLSSTKVKSQDQCSFEIKQSHYNSVAEVIEYIPMCPLKNDHSTSNILIPLNSVIHIIYLIGQANILPTILQCRSYLIAVYVLIQYIIT